MPLTCAPHTLFVRRVHETARLFSAVCFFLLLSHLASAQRTVAEQYLFHALNESRSAAGLPSLVWSDKLTLVAAEHAERMRQQGTMAHQVERESNLPERAAGSGVRFSLIAENIAVVSNPIELHDLWFGSEAHRENMLEPTATVVGIALLQSGGQVWAVEDFARTLNELTLPQQEARVSQLLWQAGVHASGSSAARAMCSTSTGFVGATPAFVMRFSATELQRLPQPLLMRLQRGRFSSAAVGACDSPASAFSSYNIAVALYR